MIAEAIPADPRARLRTGSDALTFILAGRAVLTLVSRRTGTRFTYRVRASDGKDERGATTLWFVDVLTGPNNGADFAFAGTIAGERGAHGFRRSQRSRIGSAAPSLVAFAWAFSRIARDGAIPDDLEVWHGGRCGRCGRALTVPSSIESGIGPVCEGKENG